ncbi:hypothetical protein BJ875DRAFT_473659 [Amylocarpus encephaloides]|uniref:Uncharacterized protein n=1 Tax=Amylocarpus encephaloides TaxID=45428 RepID=A0A9P8C273_9HELO|nr:hypothetical protein BJ875DRAFT_473659 [Amylocarpus encephaloides]
MVDFSNTVDLPGTKYTLTSPHFQHGPIRFSRSDLEDKRSRYAREKRYTPLHQMWEENEPLDWTAFQIAISGAVDEDLENVEDLDMKDDMWDWWEELGIGGPGRLLKDFATPESYKGEDSEERDLSVSSGIFERENDLVETDDVDINAPVLAHQDIIAAGLEVDTRYSFPSSPSTDQLVFRATQAQFDFRCKQQENTPDSLPPSPMFDLVMTHGDEGKRTVPKEFVPMGFNLGHDLEDFLEWEAKYRHIAYSDEEGDDLYEA